MAKTNWTMGETVLPDDMNQIGQEINDLAADGSITDNKIGNRTISDAAAPTGDTAKPTTLFGWLANMVKAVTGEASWRTLPSMTIKAIKTLFDNATAAATPDTLVKRDADGKFKATIPTDPQHVARKADVDLMVPKSGGSISGTLNVDGNGGLTTSYGWATISSNGGGVALFGSNCYLERDPDGGVTKYKYKVTHPSVGARGFAFLYSAPGKAYWFDTGLVATMADQEFTPTLREVMTSLGGTFTESVAIANDRALFGKGTGGDWLNLARIDGSNNAVFGNPQTVAYLNSLVVPRWFDGSTTYELAPRTSVVNDNVDLNSVVKSGFYRLTTNHPNMPAGGIDYGQLLVCQGGSDTVFQIACGINDGRMFFRNGNPPSIGGAGYWSAWREFFTTSGGNIDGTVTVTGPTVGNTIGNYSDALIVQANAGNIVKMHTRVTRKTSGSDWGTARLELLKVVDSTPKQQINMEPNGDIDIRTADGGKVRADGNEVLTTGGGQTVFGNFGINGAALFSHGGVFGDAGDSTYLRANADSFNVVKEDNSGYIMQISNAGVICHPTLTMASQILTKYSYGTVANAGAGSGGMEIRSDGSNAAFLSFHRIGSYAVHLGVDTDNQLKFGGWSAGNASYQIWHAGNSAHVVTSASAPSNPAVGDVWIDTSS